MKLSGVFVAAMVITSANAGWFDDLFGDIKIRPTRLSVTSPSATPELSPSPSATPDIPSLATRITHHHLLLIKAKNEASYYFDNTGLAEMLAEDSLGEVLGEYSDRYQKADDTVGEIYICFRKFENAMLEYLKQYDHLPETSPILTVKDLKLNIQLLRKELKSTARVSA
ncbi:hypothetical protein BASA60_004834 [Batrachochytrium salamandrivorans]|nr:hypothetical protein BASA60_004834 [Batrachochytrium salamandrivorans]